MSQTGPAGVGTTDGTSALKMWLDAGKNVFKDSLAKQKAGDSERVRYWSDLSGTHHDVSATSDSARPTFLAQHPLLNGCGTLRFTRNSSSSNKRNYLQSNSFSKTDDITIYSVFLPMTKGGGNDITPYQFVGSTNNDSLWYSGAGIVDADVFGPMDDISMTLTDTSLAVGGGDSATKTDYTVKTPLILNKAYFGSLRKEKTSGLLSVSKNGSSPSSLVAGKQPLNNAVKYTIGATSNSVNGKDNNFFDGLIAAVIVFNKLLNEAETILLENYLSTKFGISLTSHDIFKADDAPMGNYDGDFAGIGMGSDSIPQARAQGEGIVEISNPTDLGKQEYLAWAHNGQALTFQSQDVPEGVKQRLARTWRTNKTGEPGNVDLVVDTRTFTNPDVQDLVLLVDMDNNGSFENEYLGAGMTTQGTYMGNGKYLFSKTRLPDESRFTFGVLKPACQNDCEAVFTPNGDGISDTYFIENVGKTVILDKFGQLVRELNAPTYWDGIKSNGSLATEGLYFIIANDSRQKTVTLLR